VKCTAHGAATRPLRSRVLYETSAVAAKRSEQLAELKR